MPVTVPSGVPNMVTFVYQCKPSILFKKSSRNFATHTQINTWTNIFRQRNDFKMVIFFHLCYFLFVCLSVNVVQRGQAGDSGSGTY